MTPLPRCQIKLSNRPAFKLTVWVGFIRVVLTTASAYWAVLQQESRSIEKMRRTGNWLSDTFKRATRYDMLKDRPLTSLLGATRRITEGDYDRPITPKTDNGGGIPDGSRDRIFEPFFTTKEVGKGTGLGLSISYGIVRDFGGSIQVENQPGEGAVFRLSFPVRRESKA